MSVSDHNSVRPGQGVDIARLPIVPTRESLQQESFTLSDGLVEEVQALHQYVQTTPAEQVDQNRLAGVLLGDEAKTFRNSYSSLIIEKAWPHYAEAVDGPNASISKIVVDEAGLTSLEPATTEPLADLPAPGIARLIAQSNQDTLSHFICQQFAAGRIPDITPNAEANRYYFDSMEAQTSLFRYLDSDFRTLPLRVGSPAVATASGSVVLKINVFGLPNLLDALAVREGFTLTNEQHRRGVANFVTKVLPPFYPTISYISVNVHRQVMDPATLELLPEAARHNGNPDDLLVYHDPAIVQQVNADLQRRKEAGIHKANVTGCPVLYGRVPASLPGEPIDAAAPIIRMPRSLADLALRQLDRWYYPHRTPIVSAETSRP